MAELTIRGLEEIPDSLVSIDCDIPAVIVGGWFDFACIYRGVFPGLEYGLYSFFPEIEAYVEGIGNGHVSVG